MKQDIETLRSKVEQAQRNVESMETLCGKESAQYKAALKDFAVQWFILRKTRGPEEFIEGLLA